MTEIFLYFFLTVGVVALASVVLEIVTDSNLRLPKISLKNFLPSTRLKGDISSLDPERIVVGVLLARAMADIAKVETYHARSTEWQYTCLTQDGQTPATLCFRMSSDRYITANTIKHNPQADFRITVHVGTHTISVTADKREKAAVVAIVSLVENRRLELAKEQKNQKALDALALLTVPAPTEPTDYELNAGRR